MNDLDDMQWMAMFSGNAETKTKVPTTSHSQMGGDGGHSRNKRKRDAAEDQDNDPGGGQSDNEPLEEYEIDSLLGFHMDTDRSDHDDERQKQHKKQKRDAKKPDVSRTDLLRKMLSKEGARIMPAMGPLFTAAAKLNKVPTVAEALRNRHAQSNSNSVVDDDDDVPRPITLQQKYEETVRRRYVPVPYDKVDTSDDSSEDDETRQRDLASHKRECFLCAFGDRFHDGIEAPLVNRLHSIFELNYGKVENAALAQMLHLYFRKRIHTDGMEMLTQEIALEHIEQMHTLDPRIAVGELIRRYMRIFTTFENEIFLSDGSFNRHAIGAMNAAGRMILTLYKSDPIKMNFYNPKMDIDPKQMGAFSNIMSVFTTRKVAPTASRKRSRSHSSASPSPVRHADHRPTKRARHEPDSQIFF